MKSACIATLLLLLPGVVCAHGTHAHQHLGDAVIVSFDAGHDAAASSWQCSVLPPDGERPWVEGGTDPAGRFAFVPDRVGVWRVRGFAPDGHGAELTVTVDEPLLAALGGADHADDPSRTAPTGWMQLLTGVSVIFGVFGVVALARTRRG